MISVRQRRHKARSITRIVNIKMEKLTNTPLDEDLQERFSGYTELVQNASLATTEDDVLEVAAQHTSKLLNVARCSIAMLDESGEWLEIFALDGETGAIPIGKKLKLEGTLIEEAIRTRAVAVDNDAYNSRFYDIREMAKMGARAVMNAPLISCGVIIGSLNTFRIKAFSYTEEDKQSILHLAGFISGHILSARLLHATEEESV